MGLEPERAVDEERRREPLDETAERGDGLDGLAGVEEDARAEVERLVGEGRGGAGEAGVERVERGEGLGREAAAVAEGRAAVDVERVVGEVDVGAGEDGRVERVVERDAEGDGVVGGVGRRVLVERLGARERRVHEALVEVDERELVAGLLRERADPDGLVDVLEPLAGRVEVAAAEGHLAQRQPRPRRHADVAAGGGLLEPRLGGVVVAVDVAEEVRQREGRRGPLVADRVLLQVQDVGGAGRVGGGRRAEVGALAAVAGLGVPEAGAGEPGGGRGRAVGVALEDLVERAGGGLGRPGGPGLLSEHEERLALLALQPVEGADGVERHVVVALFEGQPRLELADAPVERVERRGALERGGERLGRALARHEPREAGLDGRAEAGVVGQRLEVEGHAPLVVEGEAVEVGQLERRDGVADPLAPSREHGGGLVEQPEPGDLRRDDPVRLGVVGGEVEGLGPGAAGLVGPLGAIERGAPRGEERDRPALARHPPVDEVDEVVEPPGRLVGFFELDPDGEVVGPLGVEVFEHGRGLVDAAVGEERRGERVPAGLRVADDLDLPVAPDPHRPADPDRLLTVDRVAPDAGAPDLRHDAVPHPLEAPDLGAVHVDPVVPGRWARVRVVLCEGRGGAREAGEQGEGEAAHGRRGQTGPR